MVDGQFSLRQRFRFKKRFKKMVLRNFLELNGSTKGLNANLCLFMLSILPTQIFHTNFKLGSLRKSALLVVLWGQQKCQRPARFLWPKRDKRGPKGPKMGKCIIKLGKHHSNSCWGHLGIARKGGGVSTLARMVWGTFLEKNLPRSNGHLLGFGGV